MGFGATNADQNGKNKKLHIHSSSGWIILWELWLSFSIFTCQFKPKLAKIKIIEHQKEMEACSSVQETGLTSPLNVLAKPSVSFS